MSFLEFPRLVSPLSSLNGNLFSELNDIDHWPGEAIMQEQTLLAVAILLCATVVLGSCQGGDADQTRNADELEKISRSTPADRGAPGNPLVRLIHRDSVWMNIRQTISDAWLRDHCAFRNRIPIGRRDYPDCTASPPTQLRINCVKAPRSVLPGPFLDGLQACRWFHLWRSFVPRVALGSICCCSHPMSLVPYFELIV